MKANRSGDMTEGGCSQVKAGGTGDMMEGGR